MGQEVAERAALPLCWCTACRSACRGGWGAGCALHRHRADYPNLVVIEPSGFGGGWVRRWLNGPRCRCAGVRPAVWRVAAAGALVVPCTATALTTPIWWSLNLVGLEVDGSGGG